MRNDECIFVAGGTTLIGAALLRRLRHGGVNCFSDSDEGGPKLTDRESVDDFFQKIEPDYVFLAAGKSGGIEANRRYPAELMLDNLLVSSHIIDGAFRFGVKKLLYLASSCSYPKHCPQPMTVESLLSGPLEPTNEAYAIAKIAGIKLCQAYRRQYGVNFVVGIPGNVFGPDDDFDPDNAHVIPALIHRMYHAKILGKSSIAIWGTGTPRREFVFADDLADACVFAMQNYDDEMPINMGSGTDISIAELAGQIKTITGYSGDIVYDVDRPDGMPLKALDSSVLLGMGWCPKTDFASALEITYKWFLSDIGS